MILAPGSDPQRLDRRRLPEQDEGRLLGRAIARAALDAGTAREIAEGRPPPAAARRDALYRRLLGLADVVSAAVALVVAIPILGNDTLTALGVAAIPFVVVVGKVTSLYDRDEHLVKKVTLDEAPKLFRVATLYTLLVWLAGDTLHHGYFGRDQALALWMLLFFSMVATRAGARLLARRLGGEERCLLVGDHETGAWLAGKLHAGVGINSRMVGRVPLEPDPPGANGLPLLGALDDLGLALVEHRIDRVIIVPPSGVSEPMLDVIRLVKVMGVGVSVLPRLFDVVGSSVEFDEIDGVTLLGVRRHGLSRSSRLLKRTLDLCGALLGLLVSAPLLAAVALAIKLESRGPVFFRQRRMGRDNVSFEMLKFRTMVDGAEAQQASLMQSNEAGGGLFKIEHDPRITRVGRLLRRMSLDELPQLFNVVRGDMALVGPRPLVIDEDARIEGWDRRRLLLTPGMTGMWQVFGSARIPLPEMVKIDYLYGANWSLWLDLKILVRTVAFVAGRRGL